MEACISVLYCVGYIRCDNAAFTVDMTIIMIFVHLSNKQATDRPMGLNGLDVAGLRPFDLVIPFTIQKGEITGRSHVCRDPKSLSFFSSNESVLTY